MSAALGYVAVGLVALGAVGTLCELVLRLRRR